MFGQRMSGTGMGTPCDLPTWNGTIKLGQKVPTSTTSLTRPCQSVIRPPVSYKTAPVFQDLRTGPTSIPFPVQSRYWYYICMLHHFQLHGHRQSDVRSRIQGGRQVPNAQRSPVYVPPPYVLRDTWLNVEHVQCCRPSAPSTQLKVRNRLVPGR